MKDMAQKNEKKKYPVLASMYTLLEEVGHGASAVVYKAKCIQFNEIVAIKVLDMDRCNISLEDIRREAQTMSLISHPNLLSAYCSFVVDHSLWVVMPYMAGGSCLHIMKSAYFEGFEEPIIATVLKETLKALEYLHRHGHIHRDVKAGNILIDANGAIRLGDFGVSACMFDAGDRQRSRNTFVGTPCWMAPEVMEQVNGYDFKADVWSFGITALELAHGHAPFSKYPPMKVLLMTLQNAPPGLDYERDKRFSKSFREMIAMCLVKNPAKRPTADKLLRHSFFKRKKSCEYKVRTLLDGLEPLGQRIMDLKVQDAKKFAQKKMPFDVKEEESQNEYKPGVSNWNFDIEDLKAQHASMQDDDSWYAGKEEPDLADAQNKGLPGMQRSLCQDNIKGNSPVPLHAGEGPVSSAQSGMLPNSVHLHSGEQVKASEINEDELDQQDIQASNNRGRAFSGPLSSHGATLDHQFVNGLPGASRPLTGLKDASEKGLYVQKKGRFSVTPADVELMEDQTSAPATRRSEISQETLPQLTHTCAAAVLPCLQNLLNQSRSQQDLLLISNFISRISRGEPSQAHLASDLSLHRAGAGTLDSMEVEISSDTEHALLQRVAELQTRVASLVDELQVLKLKNISLERQLNAICNKEEEERIRREDEAREGG